MAADVKLLPLVGTLWALPEHVQGVVQAYARANVAHATAALQAEIEALRAEVKRLTLDMGRLQQQYDERTACMIVHRGQALACSDAVRAAYFDESRRADKLAEALRELEEREQRDEALLRQALEALELRCGTHADERKELIPALRERLGEETGHE